MVVKQPRSGSHEAGPAPWRGPAFLFNQGNLLTVQEE